LTEIDADVLRSGRSRDAQDHPYTDRYRHKTDTAADPR
jgi:hypothetical protein